MLRNLHKTLTVNGHSGRTYTFTQFSFDDFDDIKGSLPNCGGIYVFTHAVQDNDQNPVYCGQTDDFSYRFYNHHQEPCIRRNHANRIALMRVDDQEARDEIEVDIINRYNFSCNIQHNG